MAITRAQMREHALNIVKFFLDNSSDTEGFARIAFQYSKQGAVEQEAAYVLINRAYPNFAPHLRRHKLHEGGVVDAVDIPDITEPTV